MLVEGLAMKKSPRATKKKAKSRPDKAPAKKVERFVIGPPDYMDGAPLQPDPHSEEFREEFPWTVGLACDAYTSIEAKIYAWFEKEGLDLGRGAMLDLAVRMSTCIEPFRSFYRASRGWEGYDLEQCRKKAEMAEEFM